MHATDVANDLSEFSFEERLEVIASSSHSEHLRRWVAGVLSVSLLRSRNPDSKKANF